VDDYNNYIGAQTAASQTTTAASDGANGKEPDKKKVEDSQPKSGKRVRSRKY